jgi:hypothetical protein
MQSALAPSRTATQQIADFVLKNRYPFREVPTHDNYAGIITPMWLIGIVVGWMALLILTYQVWIPALFAPYSAAFVAFMFPLGHIVVIGGSGVLSYVAATMAMLFTRWLIDAPNHRRYIQKVASYNERMLREGAELFGSNWDGQYAVKLLKE